MNTSFSADPPSIQVFFSYARRDQNLRDQLENHLSNLKYRGLVTTWHVREISAGEETIQQIDIHLNMAHLILLLISADFLASPYCYSKEMIRAMERHERGEAHVIPVLLRPVLFTDAPFAKLQPLPTNGKPVVNWRNRDSAFVDIALGIERVVQKRLASASPVTPISSMSMMDFVGQTIGQYRIEAPLGSGGMGQVYRSVHRLLNRPAAIKVMQAHLAINPDFRARFLREARSAAALKHFNIVEIYDFGEQDGHLYLVMELMTDGSLHALLRRTTEQPLPLALGLDLVQQAAKGLAVAQTLNMVHRDIKPENLLLNRLREPGQGGEQYLLKISDFGLARLAESGLTSTGVPMGTLAYMSPEQCQGKKLDGRSDLYSLGVVLYEVATGYQPFQIENFKEALDKHVNTPPPPPRQMRPDLPLIVEAIILRCLAKKPEERFATGTELAQALQAAMSDAGLETIAPLRLPLLRTQRDWSVPAGKAALQPPGMGALPPPTISTTLPGASTVPRVRVLDASGQTLQVVEVTHRGLTIGRQPDNDITLWSEAVSRQHLRVTWDGNQVTATDLGSSNGTLLGDGRLAPQVGQPWMERQWIRIGPFWLRLEGASPAGTQTVQRAVPQTAVFGMTNVPQTQVSATMVRSGRIGMAVNPRMLTITPGQPTTIQVTLINLGNIVDWFTTTVEGVAPEWIQGAGQEVQLNPGTQENVELSVNVARSANNLAREYPVIIRARSREKPDESATTQARWTVLPFKEDVLRIEPRRASGRGKAAYAVTLSNVGNAPSHYALSGDDDEQKLAYRFGQNEVELGPSREAKVGLMVGAPRHWLGREQHQLFQVHARLAGSTMPLTAPGEFVNKALLPSPSLGVPFILLGLSLLGLLSAGVLLVQHPNFIPFVGGIAGSLTFLAGILLAIRALVKRAQSRAALRREQEQTQRRQLEEARRQEQQRQEERRREQEEARRRELEEARRPEQERAYYEKALAAYEQALRQNKADVTAYRGKGNALVGLKRYDEALTAFEQAMVLTPLPTVYVSMGNVLATLGRCDEAVAAYEQALALDASYVSAYAGMSEALLQLGRTQEAGHMHERAKQLGYEE